MLTFKLSDETEFRCSACQNPVASVRNGRIVVVGLPDLITAFREHVHRYHTTEYSPIHRIAWEWMSYRK